MFIQFDDIHNDNHTITVNSDYIICINQGYTTASGTVISHSLDIFNGGKSLSGTVNTSSYHHQEIKDSDYEKIIQQLL